MSRGEALLAELEATPDDPAPREVYADFLEAAGDTPRAELVRIAGQLWRDPLDLVHVRQLHHRRATLRAQLADEPWHLRIARPSSAEVRRRVVRLGELDVDRKVFASKKHQYALGAPVSAGAIAAREVTLGCVLPAQYRRFLLEIGDGGAGPAYGLIALAAIVPSKTALRGVDRALPIAEVGFGDSFWLAVTGPRAGEVWWQAEAEHGPTGLHYLDHYLQWLDASLLHVAMAVPTGARALEQDPATTLHLGLANAQLAVVPDALRRFVRVRRLDLSRNPFASLPAWIGELSELVGLSLFGCSNLRALPEELAALDALAELDVRYCPALDPRDLDRLREARPALQISR